MFFEFREWETTQVGLDVTQSCSAPLRHTLRQLVNLFIGCHQVSLEDVFLVVALAMGEHLLAQKSSCPHVVDLVALLYHPFNDVFDVEFVVQRKPPHVLAEVFRFVVQLELEDTVAHPTTPFAEY